MNTACDALANAIPEDLAMRELPNNEYYALEDARTNKFVNRHHQPDSNNETLPASEEPEAEPPQDGTHSDPTAPEVDNDNEARRKALLEQLDALLTD